MANVIDLKTGKPITQAVTTASSKPAYDEQTLKLFRALRDAISEETEAMDTSWLDCDHDYAHVMEDDEVIKNFVENYSSRSYGRLPFDTLDAAAIETAVPKETLLNAIVSHSEWMPCDYYTQHNEMGSIQFGEIEHQIDVDTCGTDLARCLAQMSDSQLAAFNSWNHSRVARDSFFAYGNPCDRLILKLDVESFLSDETIKTALAERGHS